MAKFARHQPRGNVSKDIQRVAKRSKLQGTAKSLASSTITEGGITVRSSEGIVVADGGGVTVRDGGEIVANYPSGQNFLRAGKFSFFGGELFGHGLMIRKDQDVDDQILEVMQGWDGLTHIYMGRPASPLNQFQVWSQNIILDAANHGGNTYITHTTTSNTGPVCILNTSGIVQRSTSAAKYKQDIEDPDLDSIADAALRLKPRTWRDKGEVEKDQETTKRYLGFIAEEAGEAGLDILVYRDPDTDEVEGFSYAQVTAPLVALAQRQQREIDELKSTVADLTARLDALEAQSGGEPEPEQDHGRVVVADAGTFEAPAGHTEWGPVR